jgi:LCP family protein required for cell wall assembly
MNFRKFCTIFSLIAIFFLTISGTILAVEYLNNDKSDASPTNTNEPGTTDNKTPTDNGPFNILLMGSETSKGYTDIIMVANYDPDKNSINLLSIPGNIKADVKDENGIKKLRSAYKSHGAEYTADLLTRMLGINFKYYMYFDYSALKKIVNSAGGVEYDLPVALISDSASSGKDINLKAGKQNYSGDMAVQLLSYKKPVNNRYTEDLLNFYDGSDYSRAKLLQSFFRVLFRQKINTEIIKNSESIFSDISKNIDTNITTQNILELVKDASNVNVQNVSAYMLSGEDQKEGFYYFVYNGRIKETDSTREYKVEEIFVSPSFISK